MYSCCCWGHVLKVQCFLPSVGGNTRQSCRALSDYATCCLMLFRFKFAKSLVRISPQLRCIHGGYVHYHARTLVITTLESDGAALAASQALLSVCGLLSCLKSNRLVLGGQSVCNALQVPVATVGTTIKGPHVKPQSGINVGAQAMKSAGTSDMLAWLDAKIAAQKAALIN